MPLPLVGFCIDRTKQFEAAVTISTIGFQPFFPWRNLRHSPSYPEELIREHVYCPAKNDSGERTNVTANLVRWNFFLLYFKI